MRRQRNRRVHSSAWQVIGPRKYKEGNFDPVFFIACADPECIHAGPYQFEDDAKAEIAEWETAHV